MAKKKELTIEELREMTGTLIIPNSWKRWSLNADLHTGSPTGLTPSPNNVFQEALLDRYNDNIKWYYTNYGRPHVVMINGDPTEGIDPKLDFDDPLVLSQYQKSAELICQWNAEDEYIINTGTKIHTHLNHQELEHVLVDKIQLLSIKQYGHAPKVSIRRKLKTTVNDWFMLEARHFINRSVIPHGRSTASLRTQLWNVMNAALKSYEDEKPAKWPDLLVFGHTHYFNRAATAWGETCILPCWKAIGDKFGDEICDGHVDIGSVGLFVSDSEEKQWIMRERLYNASVVSRTENR